MITKLNINAIEDGSITAKKLANGVIPDPIDTSAFVSKADALQNYVPTTRTINDKPLSEDITLTAADVNALPVGALNGYIKYSELEDYVPVTRKINGKWLIDDITLTAADVNALSEEVLENYVKRDALQNYVPTTRTINRKPLSEDIILTAEDLRINVEGILPSDNITGTGLGNCIAKFNSKNVIESGPKLGTSTTTFLRNDGNWAHPFSYNKTPLTCARAAQTITCAETINVPAHAWCHIRAAVAASGQSLSVLAPIEMTLTYGRTIYDIVPSILIPGLSSSPGYVETWYHNNRESGILLNVIITCPSGTTIQLLSTYTSNANATITPASYYEIIT